MTSTGENERVRYLTFALTMAFHVPGATPTGHVERVLLTELGSELGATCAYQPTKTRPYSRLE